MGLNGIGPQRLGCATKSPAKNMNKGYGPMKTSNSPAKQTAKQKANLPKEIVDAISAKGGKAKGGSKVVKKLVKDKAIKAQGTPKGGFKKY